MDMTEKFGVAVLALIVLLATSLTSIMVVT